MEQLHRKMSDLSADYGTLEEGKRLTSRRSVSISVILRAGSFSVAYASGSFTAHSISGDEALPQQSLGRPLLISRRPGSILVTTSGLPLLFWTTYLKNNGCSDSFKNYW
jgi:hypothetical protein